MKPLSRRAMLRGVAATIGREWRRRPLELSFNGSQPAANPLSGRRNPRLHPEGRLSGP